MMQRILTTLLPSKKQIILLQQKADARINKVLWIRNGIYTWEPWLCLPQRWSDTSVCCSLLPQYWEIYFFFIFIFLFNCFRILSVMLISISTFITRRQGLVKKNNYVVSKQHDKDRNAFLTSSKLVRNGRLSTLPMGRSGFGLFQLAKLHILKIIWWKKE